MAKVHGPATPRGMQRIVDVVRHVERSPGYSLNPGPRFKGDGSELWLPFLNNTGSTCPGNSIVRVTGITTDTDKAPLLSIAKPDTTYGRQYAVTANRDVPNGEYGIACIATIPLRIAYDTGTPAINETWGPKPGQFTASKNYPGYRVIGPNDSTNKIMLAVPEPIEMLPFKNESATTAPHGAVMEITSRDSSGVLLVRRPTAVSNGTTTPDLTQYGKLFVFNQTGDTAQNEYGWCRFADSTSDVPVVALYDSDDGDPAANQQWGPIYNSWKLRKNVQGYTVLGNVDTSAKTCHVTMNAQKRKSTTFFYSPNSGSDADLPAYGTTQFKDGSAFDSGGLVPRFRSKETHLDPSMSRIVIINGPTEGVNTASTLHWCDGSMAIEKPAPVRYHVISNSTANAYTVGTPVGIVPGTYEMGPGLPGFIVVRSKDDGTICVMRDFVTTSWWCVAASNWTTASSAGTNMASVTAYPCLNSHGYLPYDGTNSMPTIGPLTINLPYGPGCQDPNIRTGNVFRYTIAANISSSTAVCSMLASGGLFAVEPYLDDKIGTIKAWVGGSIPQGWRRFTAADDKIITSYSTSGVDRIPINQGGGAAVASYSFVWIERYQ